MKHLSEQIKQYLIITGNYWAFTLTDGALRMLVVLYFHQLGYAPLDIALLFLFYEFFGVVTNLVGGWLGARLGLNKTMNIGLFMQIVAIGMLVVPAEYLSVLYVMFAQALSGIAKDLNKMSAKSAIKLLVPDNQKGTLFKWVALLTGSKNALKGIGFFIGGLLLTAFGFQQAMIIMSTCLVVVWLFSLFALKQDLGKKKNKPKFKEIFSKSKNLNLLSAARLFLFASRDVWFVVALPVYLATSFGWDHWWTGGFMASWVIAYGFVQAKTPKLIKNKEGRAPNSQQAAKWAWLLALSAVGIALCLWFEIYIYQSLIIGLLIFGALFAVNSSIHSFLIVDLADSDGVSMDVGFYYMANAMGRLLGTVLSGAVFQLYGLVACLAISTVFIVLAAILVVQIKNQN